MLEIYIKPSKEADFQQVIEFQPGCWVYANEASLEDLEKIASFTDLEIDDIKDSLDRYELPRLEHLKDSLILFMRHPDEQETGVYTNTLTMIFQKTCIFAISPHRSSLIEYFIGNNMISDTSRFPKVILQILFKITQDYTNSIKRVRHSSIEHVQEQALSSEMILQLMRNEEILNQYLTALVPMRNLLETLVAGRYIQLQKQDMNLLDDLMISLRQSEEICEVNIKSIRSQRDSYQIIFTNSVNKTIKLLTALTVIVTIPTIIASVYGMNVTLPFQNLSFAFWLIMGITIACTVTASLFFLRKRWM